MVKKLTIYSTLLPFLNRPHEQLHLADIARTLKSPHPTVRLYLYMLEKQGILVKTHKGRLTLYRLNLKNPLLVYSLLIAEKEKVVQEIKKSLVLKEVVERLLILCSDNQAILMFGSATQDFKKANDIDVVILGNQISGLKKIETFVNKPIHNITITSLSEISPTFKQEIIKKHLLIIGSEEIIQWLLIEN